MTPGPLTVALLGNPNVGQSTVFTALAGIPKFVEAAAPDGLAHGVAHFVMPQGFSESRYTPQVLYPVTPSHMPDWLNRAIVDMQRGPPPALRGARPVIAICIDDLGEVLAGTDRAMALPQAVAMSFLPFAETTPFLAETAARKGHLVLAHVPMQALGREDPGPMTLKTGMAPDEIVRRLGWRRLGRL